MSAIRRLYMEIESLSYFHSAARRGRVSFIQCALCWVWVELFRTPFTTSVYLSFFFSIVAFCTRQNTVGRYCEGVSEFPIWPKKQTHNNNKKEDTRDSAFFELNRWQRSVAVVLLTTDCLLLPRKIENTSTLSFNLHYRKKKKEKDLHDCVSWAPRSKFHVCFFAVVHRCGLFGRKHCIWKWLPVLKQPVFFVSGVIAL